MLRKALLARVGLGLAVLALVLAGAARAQSLGGVSVGGVRFGSPTLAIFACNNQLDDDGDGIADWPGDAGCTSPYDATESGDATVVVTASVTAADLLSCIGGANATGCTSTGAAASVTVRATSPPTLQQVSGLFYSTHANVSFAYLDFVGAFRYGADGQRLYHAQFIATDVDTCCGCTGGLLKNIGEYDSGGDNCTNIPGGLDDLVLDSSLIDGGIQSAVEKKCWDGQIIVEGITRLRVTRNTFKNFCPTIMEPCPGGDCGHAEFLFLFYGNTDVFIAENEMGTDPTHYDTNWSTGALFWTGNGGCPFTGYTQNTCVTKNNFGISGWNSVQMQRHSCNPSNNVNVEETSPEQGYDFTVGTGSTSTTIVANSGTKPAGANAYNGYNVTMTSGACNGQTKTLKDYNPTTGTWSLRTEYSESWTSCTPANGDTAHVNISNVNTGHAACDACFDGLDNDGDGKADYWPDLNGDTGCQSYTDNSE